MKNGIITIYNNGMIIIYNNIMKNGIMKIPYIKFLTDQLICHPLFPHSHRTNESLCHQA